MPARLRSDLLLRPLAERAILPPHLRSLPVLDSRLLLPARLVDRDPWPGPAHTHGHHGLHAVGGGHVHPGRGLLRGRGAGRRGRHGRLLLHRLQHLRHPRRPADPLDDQDPHRGPAAPQDTGSVAILDVLRHSPAVHGFPCNSLHPLSRVEAQQDPGLLYGRPVRHLSGRRGHGGDDRARGASPRPVLGSAAPHALRSAYLWLPLPFPGS
mmetsp:Transcript_103727/g.293197  ORF Transcript_103727/g.293197 Transcript_103727/m.293197 type:complete len:210 (-) Transcript_103727:82-711(-)